MRLTNSLQIHMYNHGRSLHKSRKDYSHHTCHQLAQLSNEALGSVTLFCGYDKHHTTGQLPIKARSRVKLTACDVLSRFRGGHSDSSTACSMAMEVRQVCLLPVRTDVGIMKEVSG